MDNNEIYEKVPDFIIDDRKEKEYVKDIEDDIPEPELLKINTKISEFSEKEQSLIKYNLLRPSSLRIELPQTLVDFENYKGKIPELFKFLPSQFQLMNKWN